MFAPSAPSPRVATAYDPPKRPKSRGPLWFGLAFLVTLVVAGGAAAAYLYAGDRSDDEVRTLPVTSESSQPVTVQTTDTGAPPVVLPADAGARAAVAPPIPDAGPPEVPAPPDAGPPDAGAEGAEVGEARVEPEAIADEAEEAEPVEESAGAARSDSLRHFIRLANFQRNAGNLREAESNYMRALRLDPDNPRVLAGLARLNMARGNSGAAVRYARQLVATNTQNASNHVLLGDALERSGNHRGALQSWRRALELSPGLRSARQRLGE
jgi:hypothetical protein